MRISTGAAFLLASALTSVGLAEELAGCLERRGESYVLRLQGSQGLEVLQIKGAHERFKDFVGKTVSLSGIRQHSGVQVTRIEKLGDKCDAAPIQSGPGLPKELWGQWVHSREEDQPGVRVYRPLGSKLPPSRGRDGFSIDPSGKFTELSIGRGDGLDSQEGRWKLLDPHEIQVATEPNDTKRVLRILNVTPDKLELYDSATDPRPNVKKWP